MNQREKMFSAYHPSIYSQSNVFTEEGYEDSCLHFDFNFQRDLPAEKDAHILDIGCGGGHFLYFLKKKGYTNSIGIDLSSEAIEMVRKRITPRVEQADAFGFLPTQRDTYDAIYSGDMIEHIPKERVLDFLSLVRDALKPGGVLLLRLPNMGNPFALHNRYRDFTHECGYTEKSIYQVLYVCGFRDIRVRPDQTDPRKSVRSFLSRVVSKTLYTIIKKLFWHQGFTSPEILTSRIVAIARR